MVRYQYIELNWIELNVYIWFAKTPCVYLLARQSLFLENCLSLFYYRGVDLSDVRETSQFWKKTVLPFNYPGGRYKKLAGTTSIIEYYFNQINWANQSINHLIDRSTTQSINHDLLFYTKVSSTTDQNNLQSVELSHKLMQIAIGICSMVFNPIMSGCTLAYIYVGADVIDLHHGEAILIFSHWYQCYQTEAGRTK